MPAARIISLRERLRTAFGRQPPEILMSGEATVPVALGYRRPTVLLPSAFLTRFNDDQLFQMLVHECAHAVRRDTLVGLYQRFWPAYFVSSLMYVANRLLDHAREQLCDNQLAPSLVRSLPHLENRVAELLDPRR